MNYAVFWDTEKTVVLYGSDVGVYAYRVTTEKQLIKAPIDYKLGEKLKKCSTRKWGDKLSLTISSGRLMLSTIARQILSCD